MILQRWTRLVCCLWVLAFSPLTASAAEADQVPVLGPRISVTLELLDGRELSVTTLSLAGGNLRVRSREGELEVPVWNLTFGSCGG